MKLVYLGTSEFAEEPLRKLVLAGHHVLAVVTQPDRPKGRGRKLLPPPVKVAAHKLGLEVLQPEDPNSDSFVSKLEGLKPDVMVVTSYGHKLSPKLLGVPSKGCINIHASLLPRYRGAAPVNWAIINGEKKTGISIIRMNEKIDAGEILKQDSIQIGDDETAGELSASLSSLGSQVLLLVLSEVEHGTARGIRQDDGIVTKAPKIKKGDCEVQWTRSAAEIRNLVRGLYPKPGAYTSYKGRVMKLARAVVSSKHLAGEPGNIAGFQDGIEVITGDGALSLLSLQPEGKREMTWLEFKNGFRPAIGERFGR
jgi:methionyl-tRNA formyltransferase